MSSPVGRDLRPVPYLRGPGGRGQARIAAIAGLVAGLVTLGLTEPAPATPAFPAIDVAKICADASVAVDAGRAEAACRRQEADARTALRGRWAGLSPADRSVCVGDAELGTARSYADILGCIDTSRELGREKALAGGAKAAR